MQEVVSIDFSVVSGKINPPIEHAATTTGDCMHKVSWALVVKGLKADSVRNLRYEFLYNFCGNLL